MGVRADEGVGKRERALGRVRRHDDAREVFEVDLVHDAGVRRHHAEVVERALAPSQKRVAFLVTRELELGVLLERAGHAEVVHLHGVVDDQLDGLQRVDLVRVAAQAHDAVAHGGQIHHAGHAGEILQQDARGHERDFALRGTLHVPRRQRLDVGLLDEPAILVPEQILQQNLERVRQAGHFRKPRGRQRRQAVHQDRAARNRQRLARSEAVHGRHESVLEKFHRTTRNRGVLPASGRARITKVSGHCRLSDIHVHSYVLTLRFPDDTLPPPAALSIDVTSCQTASRRPPHD